MLTSFPTAYRNVVSKSFSSSDQDEIVYIGRSETAMWMRVVSSWVCTLLYIWSLVAPVLMPDRWVLSWPELRVLLSSLCCRFSGWRPMHDIPFPWTFIYSWVMMCIWFCISMRGWLHHKWYSWQYWWLWARLVKLGPPISCGQVSQWPVSKSDNKRGREAFHVRGTISVYEDMNAKLISSVRLWASAGYSPLALQMSPPD